MNDFLARTAVLTGEGGIKKLKVATVTVIGIGGVGGYAVEMLARTGIGRLILADGDKVDISNINRQIIALQDSVGSYKTLVMAERIKAINPDCEIITFEKRFDSASKGEILGYKPDFIIDAIDSVPDKVELICEAQRLDIPLISAMGAGRRLETPFFEIADIFKTEYDPLAKKMRGLLKGRGIKKQQVCYTKSAVTESQNEVIGSIAYTPALCGITIGAYVIQQLLKE